jgi:DNA-directed RNA polymerase beta subunit
MKIILIKMSSSLLTGKLKLTQEHIIALGLETSLQGLINEGFIEYVDVNEENNCYVALNEASSTPSYTHREIDPLTIRVSSPD